MTKDNAISYYKETVKKLKAFQYIAFLASWDSQTQAPKESFGLESEQLGLLSEMQYGIQTDPKFIEAINTLYEVRNELDDVLSHEIEVQHKEVEQVKKIPKEEFSEFSKLIAGAYPTWVEAKQKSDFSIFAPLLEKIIAYKKKETAWLATEDRKGYDVLLDMYEPGLTKEDCDRFFGVLKEKLVPFIKKVTSTELEGDFAFGDRAYPRRKQREFCEYLRDVLCFDKNRGLMMESEHPFTTNFGTDDIRITNHYYPNNFTASVFSVIHETGHSLYELQCDRALNETLSGGGASMAMHESQSRFYENMIGRSRAFWEAHYAKLQYVFPEQLEDVDLDLFMKYINRTEISFVRTAADELTYPLHIMVRYDLEKEFIENDIPVEKLPELWNQKFEEYFGVTPPDDQNGILQDVHWCYGDIGYFPTYALGSAYAAQFFDSMNKDFDVYASLASGDTKEVNEWLKEKIHRFGSSKYPKEIIRYATGKDFDPNYYVDYLIKKYSAVYGIAD